MVFTTSSTRGGRSDQQDRVVAFNSKVTFNEVVYNISVCGVFDGHLGDSVAETASKIVINSFLITNPLDLEHSVRDIFREVSKASELEHSGSTMTLACVNKETQVVVLGVLGDSPAVILTEDDELISLPTHGAFGNKVEQQAVIDRGGFYHNGFICRKPTEMGLQMTRALGDCWIGDILSTEPDIYIYNRPKAFLLSTDGLFEQVTSRSPPVEDVGKHLRSNFSADVFLEHKRESGIYDNTSLVVWYTD